MSMTPGEAAVKNLTDNLTDKATYERLEKDVTAVKNDIAALTDQITDALNTFAGAASKQARRGYKQARANAEQTMDDMSERGGAMMGAAQDAAYSIEEIARGRHHPAPAGDRWPRTRHRLSDGRDLAQVRAMARRRKPNFWSRWRRWWAAASFVDVLYQARRGHVSATDR